MATIDQADARWLHRNVPDPCTSMSVHLRRGGESVGRRWLSQRERRSEILAAARTLMTQTSFEQLRLQEVAATCGVAVQTVYNLVGNREELVGSSAEEWVQAIWAVARVDAERRDVNAGFTLLAMFWSSALVRPDYVRSAARSTLVNSADLRLRFCRAGTAALLDDLKRVRSQGGVRDGVDIASLARQLSLTANSTIALWAVERYSVDAFWADLCNGAGLMLAGALRGSELLRLERGIAGMAG